MLSSDKNVETIAQLAGVLKHYFTVQSEYVKLDIIDKVVQLVTIVALVVILSVIFLFVLFFFSTMVAELLKSVVDAWIAYAIIAAFYIVLFILTIIFRKKWIERPLVKILATILMQ